MWGPRDEVFRRVCLAAWGTDKQNGLRQPRPEDLAGLVHSLEVKGFRV